MLAFRLRSYRLRAGPANRRKKNTLSGDSMTATFFNAPLPAHPFFSTPEQRLALARERFFEQGIRPSGLVGEAVIQSWSRCVQARRDPGEAIAFNPVTESRIHSRWGAAVCCARRQRPN